MFSAYFYIITSFIIERLFSVISELKTQLIISLISSDFYSKTSKFNSSINQIKNEISLATIFSCLYFYAIKNYRSKVSYIFLAYSLYTFSSASLS